MEILNSKQNMQFKEGHTLPQPYYMDETIFKEDIGLIGKTQWMLVDHESRIPNTGDYFVFEYGIESVIVIRDKKGEVQAHYNVCRHRGSRICLEHQGNTRALTCPYHAWSYDLEGNLRSAMHMPEDFDKSEKSLIHCHVNVSHGLIFLNLAKVSPPSFDEFINRFLPYLEPFNLKKTKIAARISIPNAANWKLVVENFFECYHCKPAHHTYCTVHDELKLLAFGAGPGSADEFADQYLPIYEKWAEAEQLLGNFTGMFSDDYNSQYFQSAGRMLIGKDNLTETIDGTPAAPLLGTLSKYDGSQSGCVFNPLSTLLINNDYAVIFRFTPRSALLTDAEAIWLVNENAEEGKDYSVDKLTEIWKITLGEDKKITQDNQLGVMSEVYTQGRYSNQEKRIADFTKWYMIQSDALPL
jgi:Rieske 2Fe-2S family protein